MTRAFDLSDTNDRLRPEDPATRIRPYAVTDASGLTSLFRSSVREIASRDYTASQIRAWAPDVIDEERFGKRCESRSTWVAELEGRIAGFSDLEPDGHVDMVYVHPDCQRRGIARALLRHIEETARTTGLRRLYTEASITARPVFEAAGFRVIAQQTVTVRGETMTNYRMEKQLEPPAEDSR
jgi:putative acetyltransferase